MTESTNSDDKKQPVSEASEIIRSAAQIVEGIRNQQHGEKERSFKLIAQFWTGYLEGRKTNGPVTPLDVAQMMVLLKIARSIQGEPALDHFVDQAGYSGIAGELSQKQKSEAKTFTVFDTSFSSLKEGEDTGNSKNISSIPPSGVISSDYSK